MIRQELAEEFQYTNPFLCEADSGESISNEQLCLLIKSGQDQHGQMVLQLMRQNAGLIFKLSKPFRINRDEVSSVAFFATCRACKYWDEGQGSYTKILGWCLIRELICAKNDASATSRYNIHLTLWEYHTWCRDYVRQYGRDPTDAEIMNGLKISKARLQAIRQAISIENATRLSAPIESDDGEGGELGDFIPDESAMPVDMVATDSCYQSQLQAALSEALDRLPENQSRAIKTRFFENGPADTKTIHNGLTALSKERQLAGFLNENFFSGNGLSIFQHTWTSGPERVIVQHGTKPRRKGERQ